MVSRSRYFSSANLISSRVCRHNFTIKCRHSSCDIFDCISGNVFCCSSHPNPLGRNVARRIKRVPKKGDAKER